MLVSSAMEELTDLSPQMKLPEHIALREDTVLKVLLNPEVWLNVVSRPLLDLISKDVSAQSASSDCIKELKSRPNALFAGPASIALELQVLMRRKNAKLELFAAWEYQLTHPQKTVKVWQMLRVT